MDAAGLASQDEADAEMLGAQGSENEAAGLGSDDDCHACGTEGPSEGGTEQSEGARVREHWGQVGMPARPPECSQKRCPGWLDSGHIVMMAESRVSVPSGAVLGERAIVRGPSH